MSAFFLTRSLGTPQQARILSVVMMVLPLCLLSHDGKTEYREDGPMSMAFLCLPTPSFVSDMHDFEAAPVSS